MNITKENFDQYTAIADDLFSADKYLEALPIAQELLDMWEDWPKDDAADVDINGVIRVLASAQWRVAEDAEDFALLAEQLNNLWYWSDGFIEDSNNITGALVAEEKALAYEALAIFWCTSNLRNLYNHYVERAIEKIDQAIEKYCKLAEDEEYDEEDKKILEKVGLNAKVNKARILRLKSNNLARRYAISLFGEDLDEEQKEGVMEIYEEATDVLFDDFFAKKEILTVLGSEDADNEVKGDVAAMLLEKYAEPGNDDLYWWLFTHKNVPEDRKKIRIVENIEDAADNDFDDVPWVFTLDRIPDDIEFDEGHPMAGCVYEMDAANDVRYHLV